MEILKKRKLASDERRYSSVSRLKWTVSNPANYPEDESDINFEFLGLAHDNNPEGFGRLHRTLEIIQRLFGAFELTDIDYQDRLSIEHIADHFNASNKTEIAVAAVRAEFPTAFVHPVRIEAVSQESLEDVEVGEEEIFEEDTDIFRWCDVSTEEVAEYIHGSPARA
jgi:hypothetical protein